ncbi:MAG: hypothetical protein EP332_05470 [Bacteroidetes bacterium]|nr:MAG: hypothetical protein EP332_05470 [Bacteroidota bacterium]
MEKALRFILPVIIIALAFLLYKSVADPIKEQAKVDYIEGRIKERMGKIKQAQFAYRDRFDKFAPSFEELNRAMNDEKMPLIKVTGDKEDTNSVVVYDTTYISLYEHAFGETKVNLDSLPFVPENADKVKFEMKADVIVVNETPVAVFMIKDPKPYSKKRGLILGSTSEPIFTGNWE